MRQGIQYAYSPILIRTDGACRPDVVPVVLGGAAAHAGPGANALGGQHSECCTLYYTHHEVIELILTLTLISSKGNAV